MKQRKKSRAVCLLILAGLLRAAEAVPVKANVSLFYFNTLNNSSETVRCECGLYGVHSPAADAQGLVVIPNSTNLQACTWDTEFVASRSPWVALIERGNCTFTEKINRAAVQGAEAVVIYNYPSRGNYTVPMAHPAEGECLPEFTGYYFYVKMHYNWDKYLEEVLERKGECGTQWITVKKERKEACWFRDVAHISSLGFYPGTMMPPCGH
ncbi:UNVERIFIED_CONTAM: hypothetical protein K2H54_037762 [Gekko kuhli]